MDNTTVENRETYTREGCVEALHAGYKLGISLTEVFLCYKSSKYTGGGHEPEKVVSNEESLNSALRRTRVA